MVKTKGNGDGGVCHGVAMIATKNSERRDEFDVLLFTRHKEKIVFSVWFELLGK